jgi:hypothetical protein
MSDGITDGLRRDRALERRIANSLTAKAMNEALKEDHATRPIYGGLITDPLPAKVRKLEERVKALEIFALKMIQNTKPLDPEFSKVADKHFWELGDGKCTTPKSD